MGDTGMSIVFEDVEKEYDGTYALRGVSFRIGKGSTTGLLGPNGAGKTTSLKIAIGLVRPTRGRVLVAGMEPLSHERGVKGMTGFLPERPVYPGFVTVRVLLRHLARLRGLSPLDAERAARLAGLQQYVDSRVDALSRGYLQRLGLAQALLGEPEILLLDEPTANLDPRARIEILELIARLKEDLGATVVISSHILPELQQVIDHAVFISRGRVVDYGSLEELTRRYGARIVYRLDTPEPRLLARMLLEHSYVRGVLIHDGWLEVHVEAVAADDFKEEVERLRGRGLASDLRVKSGYLGELYERVIGVPRA
jgi:ABC-type multidrug transport system ATPase subunit